MAEMASTAPIIHKEITWKTSNLLQRTIFNWEIMDFGYIFFDPSKHDRKLESPSFVSHCGNIWKINFRIDNSDVDFTEEHDGNTLKFVIERESQANTWSQFQLDFPDLILPEHELPKCLEGDHSWLIRHWTKNHTYVYEPGQENVIFLDLFTTFSGGKSEESPTPTCIITLLVEEESTPVHVEL